ncbi:MAG: hypothetical protein DSZ30_01400 [Aquificaceae bacterium]|nr:MAG: hypothetical protein DSZ30_01400 [Aquificaceae bacterium]
MLVNIIFSETGVLYRDVQNIFTRIEKNPVFSSYDLAIFVIPPIYDKEVVKSYLKNFFGGKPFIAFYSNFVGSNDFFTEKGLVGIFLKKAYENSFCEIKIFENLEGFKQYIANRNTKSFVHLIFVPYPLVNFRQKFKFFEGFENVKTEISGLITAGYDYDREYPIIVNGKEVKDGRIAVLTFNNLKGCLASSINFKKIGPPFDFTSEDTYKLKTVDGQDAIDFFLEILKRETNELSPEILVGFPMLVKNEGDNYRKLVRFPKEVRDGELIFWANLPEKGQFHFVYLLPDRVKVKNILKRHCKGFYPVSDFAIFFYCVGKSAFVNPKEDAEFIGKRLSIPFVIVGSYGEIFTFNEKIYMLNGSTTFLLLKEGFENDES